MGTIWTWLTLLTCRNCNETEKNKFGRYDGHILLEKNKAYLNKILKVDHERNTCICANLKPKLSV